VGGCAELAPTLAGQGQKVVGRFRRSTAATGDRSLAPLRNNQTDPSDPTYTGKIMALDTIYQMDSTVVRGNSTDPGNPLGPFQAPIIPFSWNLPGNQLPYSYTMEDPSQLQANITDPNFGAGAGVLTWAKTNWLKTAY
jgi:pectate lyase